jgi:hypothetical protein
MSLAAAKCRLSKYFHSDKIGFVKTKKEFLKLERKLMKENKEIRYIPVQELCRIMYEESAKIETTFEQVKKENPSSWQLQIGSTTYWLGTGTYIDGPNVIHFNNYGSDLPINNNHIY